MNTELLFSLGVYTGINLGVILGFLIKMMIDKKDKV